MLTTQSSVAKPCAKSAIRWEPSNETEASGRFSSVAASPALGAPSRDEASVEGSGPEELEALELDVDFCVAEQATRQQPQSTAMTRLDIRR